MSDLRSGIPYKVLQLKNMILALSREEQVQGPIRFPHYIALRFLGDLGPMSQKELGDVMNKDKNLITQYIDCLESEGLVCRERGLQDRRCFLVKVTDAGQACLAANKDVIPRFEEKLLAGLSPEEKEIFSLLLSKVISRVKEED